MMTKGKKPTPALTLLNAQMLNGPNYYLAQNDILIVEPNKPKTQRIYCWT